MEEKKKPSKILIFMKFIFSFTFPFLKLLGMNTSLRRCIRVVDNKQWKIFLKKQIRHNYILSLLITLPSIFMIFYAYNLVNSDAHLAKRYDTLIEKSEFYEVPFELGSLYEEQKNDSRQVKLNKEETRVRLLAASILLIISLIYSAVFSLMILYLHPTLIDNQKLKKILTTQGIIEKGDEDNAIVFSTPIGFLLDVGTTPAREIAESRRIWPKMNIKIKKYYEDPKQRSVVFFEKAYELKPIYTYESL